MAIECLGGARRARSGANAVAYGVGFLPQDAHLLLIEEASECARYLHSYYLLEAEPSTSLPASLSEVQFGGHGRCGCSRPDGDGTTLPGSRGGTATPGSACRLGERANAVAPEMERPFLRSLAFPSSPLPATCKLLLQQYPCLRSPAVLTRLLQGREFNERPPGGLASSAPSRWPQTATEKATEVTAAAARGSPTRMPWKNGELTYRPNHLSGCEEERQAFLSSVRLHFSGIDSLAAQLTEDTNASAAVCVDASCGAKGNWRDIGGRLAATEAGAAAVEAGIAPWEAAELFADVFKTSVLG